MGKRWEMGQFDGSEMGQFVREQQEIARTERQLQREADDRAREEAQRQRDAEDRAREDAAAVRAHELEVIRLRGEPQNNQQRNTNAKSPKLPSFNEQTDQMDSYIQRFERYARASQWRVEDWATSLGTLLTGKALESYSRLSEEDAVNYNELKNT